MATIYERVKFRMMRPFHTRACPICGWHGFSFLPFGNEMLHREEAMCHWCHSLERHRAVWVMMRDRLEQGGWRTIHVAPESQIQPWLEEVSNEYVSIDLLAPHVMRNMDITAMEFEDNSYTLFWASHVLEHVPDDAKAFAEIHRVLAPGGVAMIQVPIVGDKTYEDWSITAPEDRLKAFMQEDHVRLYGLDIADRIANAGFDMEVKRVQELSPATIERYGLSFRTTNEVFVATKLG